MFRALLAVLALLLTPAAATAAPTLQFLGEDILPTGLQFDGTEVGGLSSIAYDAAADRYYVISDDQSVLDPARYYTFALDVADGNLDPGDVAVTDVTTLLDAAGMPFPAASFDPEGLALTAGGELVITSEGIANALIPPWVRLFGLDGQQRADLPVPEAFIPAPGRGVRQNLGFESGTVVGPYFYTGSEGALVQDGPAAGLGVPSPARLLRYNLKTGRPDRQYLYWTDPIAEPPVPVTNFAVNGLVELLALDKHSYLSMERSFSAGAPGTGNTIKLYTVEISGAQNIGGRASLAGQLGSIEPVEKTLLLDLDALGIPLDNVEGMAFGPDLADGRRTLVLVSDNNFAPAQFTQFLLFAYSEK
jgi:3-phytase